MLVVSIAEICPKINMGISEKMLIKSALFSSSSMIMIHVYHSPYLVNQLVGTVFRRDGSGKKQPGHVDLF